MMSHEEISKVSVAAFCLAVILSCAQTASAGGQPGGMATEITQAVRDYMEAIDAGDLDRQMGFWSQDPNVTSVIMGEIWKGYDNIRACSADYVPVSKLMRNELGGVTVVPLGTDAGIAVSPYRPIRRKPEDERLRPYEIDSMLTLIWKRMPQGWRIIHEHVSAKVPPPTGK